MLANLGESTPHLLLIKTEEVDHVASSRSLIYVPSVEIGTNYGFSPLAFPYTEQRDLIRLHNEPATVQFYAIVTDSLVRSQFLSQSKVNTNGQIGVYPSDGFPKRDSWLVCIEAVFRQCL